MDSRATEWLQERARLQRDLRTAQAEIGSLQKRDEANRARAARAQERLDVLTQSLRTHPPPPSHGVAAPLLGAGGGLCLAAGLTLTARLAAPSRLGALTSLFLSFAYLGFAVPFGMAVTARATTATVPLAAAAALAALLTLRLAPVARAGRL